MASASVGSQPASAGCQALTGSWLTTSVERTWPRSPCREPMHESITVARLHENARQREKTRENAKVSATRTRTIRTGRH